MYKSPADLRKSIQRFGWASITVAGAMLGISAAMHRYDFQRDWSRTLSVVAAGLMGIGAVLIIIGFFFPRDLKSENHTLRLARPEECSALRRFAEDWLGPVIPSERQLQDLLAANPDICYVIESKPTNESPDAKLVGCFSILPLKRGAVDHLETGDLTGNALRPDHICRKKGRPRGFYVGTVIGSDLPAKAFALAMLKQELDRLCLKHGMVKVFGRPITPDGLRILKKYKFKKALDGGEPVMNFVCYKVWKPGSIIS